MEMQKGGVIKRCLFFAVFNVIFFCSTHNLNIYDYLPLCANMIARLPPRQIEQNLSGLLNLLPEQTDELLQVRGGGGGGGC